MIKLITLFIICFATLSVSAKQQSDSLLISFKNNSIFSVSSKPNKKLIIFLHGGINNPYFKQTPDKIELNYLIEYNNLFYKKVLENAFDLAVPITTDSLNWLNNPKKTFNILKQYVESIDKKYNEVYISGFSDGGTGAFKIFYNNPDYFSGLMVFNGYPQHQNFYKKVNYAAVKNKKVIFFSTFKDKTIPYEFLLTEYCNQKIENPNTYFYLADGHHSFKSYKRQDFNQLFNILTGEVSNSKTEPIQGFVINDKLTVFYRFRKKIIRKYHFGKDIYLANKIQQKKYLKP